MNLELRNRTALITGSSSGIGSSMARELARCGADLVLVARRRDALENVAGEIRAQNSANVRVFVADLSDASARAALRDRLTADAVNIDILVNNAGIGVFGEFVAADWQRVDQCIQLDVVAVVHLTHLFLPGMLRRHWGRILLVGSTGSFQPTPYYAVYGGAKSFVLSFGVAIRHETRGTGVSCTTLCPGFTATEFFRAAGDEPTGARRRMMMSSADVARIGVRAMLAGSPSVVAGRLNALLSWSTRLIPRSWAAASAARLLKG